ncbi:hypothetical protein OPKNFCMD_5706 [Methylobacterium crusticola]|uniref:Uncharacterized protein n=1 Tax=Methylobacterium crusticola TaxID=1697972 RepID=A0ABQ4R5K8_9HYPH|nr:hypothetical protein [Methylobacterium crusticola]GJD52938.1 hypothetical protein OPKNFCMD_5706 [Methylobacterium crusticola]
MEAVGESAAAVFEATVFSDHFADRLDPPAAGQGRLTRNPHPTDTRSRIETLKRFHLRPARPPATAQAAREAVAAAALGLVRGGVRRGAGRLPTADPPCAGRGLTADPGRTTSAASHPRDTRSGR